MTSVKSQREAESLLRAAGATLLRNNQGHAVWGKGPHRVIVSTHPGAWKQGRCTGVGFRLAKKIKALEGV